MNYRRTTVLLFKMDINALIFENSVITEVNTVVLLMILEIEFPPRDDCVVCENEFDYRWFNHKIFHFDHDYSLPRVATTVATLLVVALSAINYALQQGAPMFISKLFLVLTRNASYLCSLFSPIAFSLGLTEILAKEPYGGVQWDNVNQSSTGTFTMQGALIMLLVDIVIYYPLAFYLNRIVPSEYGIPSPW